MKVCLFDLDETLTNHKFACQMGLNAIMALHPGLQVKTVEQLESEFWKLLNSNYSQVLHGKLSMNDTRIDRIAALFRGCSLDLPGDMEQLADLYVHHYNGALRAIPGIMEVMTAIKQHNMKIAVITNGFTNIQRKKLETCGLTPYVDELITSEDVGVTKPDPEIYTAALQRCHVTPDQVIMIGDGWENDIESAHAIGIRTVWLNRRNEPCPDASITSMIYEPMELLDVLFR